MALESVQAKLIYRPNKAQVLCLRCYFIPADDVNHPSLWMAPMLHDIHHIHILLSVSIESVGRFTSYEELASKRWNPSGGAK